MTVYIEYVIIDNLIIDYLILKATFAVMGISYKRRWLFLCAFFGAFVALLLPLFERLAIISTLVKVLTGLLLPLMATRYKSAREYYITALVFFLLTFLSGGAIIGVFTLLGISYSSEISIAVMVVPAYVIIKAVTGAVKGIYRKKDVMSAIFKVQIVKGKRRIFARGFIDTGNMLYDKDSPVIVCEKKLFYQILGNDLLFTKFKKIRLSTIASESENISFKVDSVQIYLNDRVNTINNVTVCLSEKSVGVEYDVILHSSFAKGDNNESHSHIEKVS